MSPRKLLAAATVLSVIVVLSAETIADSEEDNPDFMLATSPLAGEVYLPTSDIVVTGLRNNVDDPIIVHIKDARNVIVQNGFVDPVRGSRRWHCRLSSQDTWPSGEYRIELRGVLSGTSSFPITIYDDGSPKQNRNAPLEIDNGQPPPQGERAVKLGESKLTKPDGDPAKPDSEDNSDSKHEKEASPPAVAVIAGQPFSIQGSLRFSARSEANEKLFVVVLRIRKRIDEETSVITQETAAVPDVKPRDAVVTYRQRIRAPERTGNYTLEALYRRQVIAGVPLKVEPME